MNTLISSYYNNDWQLLHYWLPQAYACRDIMKFILVDDNSQKRKAIDVYKEFGKELPLEIYYVTEDKGFNSHGCRNLGALKATTESLILLDMDKQVGAAGMHMLPQAKPGEFYRFYNWRGEFKPTNNNFVLNRSDFISVKGYDEEYAPDRGGDAMFRRLMNTFCKEIMLEVPIVCTEEINPKYDRTRKQAARNLGNQKANERLRSRDFSKKPFADFKWKQEL